MSNSYLSNKLTFESGFPDQSTTMTASVATGTITFTIGKVGGYYFYQDGKKVYKTGTVAAPDSVEQLTAVAGTNYFVYFANGVLTIDGSWDLSNTQNVPIATVYYDGTNVILCDERHGAVMDWKTHEYLHETIGARYSNGLTAVFATDTAPTPDTVTMSIDSGEIFDEDIKHTITGPITTCRVFYRSGATAGSPFLFTALQAEPFMRASAGGPLAYNQYISGTTTWQLTDVGTSNYAVSWVFSSNEPAAPIWVIIDQTAHTSITSARNALFSSLSMGNLPSREMKLLYKLIIRKSTTTSNVTYTESADYRTISTVPTATYVASDHNALSNRSAAGSHPASAIAMLFGVSDIEIPITGTGSTAALGYMHVCSGTSTDYTFTLPTAVGDAGKMIGIRMSNALTKLVTIDGDGTELIDGSQTRIMWAGESAILISDGTSWKKIAGKSIPMNCYASLTSAQSVNHNTATTVRLNSLVDGIAAMFDSGNYRILTIRPSFYTATFHIAYDNVVNSNACFIIGSWDWEGLLYPVAGAYPKWSITNSASKTLNSIFTLVAFHYQGASITLNTGGNNAIEVVEIPQW